jgi:hypothetical protein
MKVVIDEFKGLELGNNGIELKVYGAGNAGEHIGDLYLKKTGIVWCVGRTTEAKGKKISWEEFAALAARNWKTV